MFSIKSFFLAIVLLCVVIKFTKGACVSSGTCGSDTTYFDNKGISLTSSVCAPFFIFSNKQSVTTINECCDYCVGDGACNYFIYDKNTQECFLYVYTTSYSFEFGYNNCFISSPNHYAGYRP